MNSALEILWNSLTSYKQQVLKDKKIRGWYVSNVSVLKSLQKEGILDENEKFTKGGDELVTWALEHGHGIYYMAKQVKDLQYFCITNSYPAYREALNKGYHVCTKEFYNFLLAELEEGA